MESKLEKDHRELQEIAAWMYALVEESYDIGECLNPDSSDESCINLCEDCGFYSCALRDDLLRLGVEI